MAFFYRDGKLKVGSPTRHLDVEELARSADGPVYIYDLDEIDRRAHALEKAFVGTPNTIHFAMKANSHHEILRTLNERGAGVDTVSAGEIKRALEAGLPAAKIVFSGVAKTKAEIEFALHAKIKQINVESPQELTRIAEIAERMGTVAHVAFRLNPDVNPKTHPYITTGFRDNKFGMDESFIPELLMILAKRGRHLHLRGLTMHIGSLLFDLEVLREAIAKTLKVHRGIEESGHRLDRLDIGGGLGIRYETEDESSEYTMIEAYGRMVRQAIEGLDVELLTEPGRIIAARAGILVGEVQYIKATQAKTFAILDTGMHHLIRPALYGAKHRVLPVTLSDRPKVVYDVVGPICESSDFLAKETALPEIQSGDLIAIADAGAYGYAMASSYNSHALPSELVVRAGHLAKT